MSWAKGEGEESKEGEEKVVLNLEAEELEQNQTLEEGDINEDKDILIFEFTGKDDNFAIKACMDLRECN